MRDGQGLSPEVSTEVPTLSPACGAAGVKARNLHEPVYKSIAA
jgi:hypothetical protein